MKLHEVYIGLGANLGKRKMYLKLAVDALNELGVVEKQSSVFETKAWGKTNQPDFLNQVALLKTDLEPLPLLRKCQTIENQLGRVRVEKWGPRTIDLDILLYDDLEMETEELTIPHPYMWEREFVMKPLGEIRNV